MLISDPCAYAMQHTAHKFAHSETEGQVQRGCSFLKMDKRGK